MKQNKLLEYNKQRKYNVFHTFYGKVQYDLDTRKRIFIYTK